MSGSNPLTSSQQNKNTMPLTIEQKEKLAIMEALNTINVAADAIIIAMEANNCDDLETAMPLILAITKNKLNQRKFN